MASREINIITEAFSQWLLALGKEVHTLTGYPNNPNPFGKQVQAYPFDFVNKEVDN